MGTSNYMLRWTTQKLNTSNYYLWGTQIEVLLRCRGLWGFIDDSEVLSTTESGLPTYDRKRDQSISIVVLTI